jgi:DNA adenine methylase
LRQVANMQNKISAAHPFLKWAGGKGQLLKQFDTLFPVELKKDKIKNYYEPFLGSGAVFFDIANHYNIKSAQLSDINQDLIITYLTIQSNVEKLIESLSALEKKYLKLSADKRKEFYYAQRENFNSCRKEINFSKQNDGWIKRATQVIFLNRTCFNGLYRVNSKGDFNTPSGVYTNPTICDHENLLKVSNALSIAEIKCAGYAEALRKTKNNSFIYLDPPYRPLTKSAAFTAYSHQGFIDVHQIELANVFTHLSKKGNLVMLSNSDPKNVDPNDTFFDDLYTNFRIARITARRGINSDATKRGVVNEIVVMNY